MAQSSYTLACDSSTTSPPDACQAGSLWTPSSNDSFFTGSATRPSTLPSTTYCQNCTSGIQATESDWIGLQSCIVSACSSNLYLIQVGVWYGWNTTYTSQKPVLFEEFYSTNSNSACTSSQKYLCADVTGPIGSGDNLFFSLTYETTNSNCLNGADYWNLFAEDSTANYYQTYVVCVGPSTGLYDIPYSSIHYALTTAEGRYAASSSYFPGNFTFNSIVGVSSSGTDQTGSRTDWKFPVETSGITATIGGFTYSCAAYGTCGQDSTTW